ncbi:MAG: SPOR domain-containing protein [Candidatus Omnitrophota bacterium]
MRKKFKGDFFEGGYPEKRSIKPSFLSKYSAQRFLPHVRVPTEYTVIIAIGILILMIVAYAVGVERGKRIQAAQLAKERLPKAQVLENKRVTTTTRVTEPEKKEQAAPVATKTIEKAQAYTIQLASFKNEDSARAEIVKLKKMGFKASFSKKGSWYQVYIGGYRNMEEALEARKKLVKYYKDCYIRKTE